jgi:hypothetical protein
LHEKERLLLDRSISGIATSLRRNPLECNRDLRTFDHAVHDYGTYFGGFRWDLYGCGTYRTRKTHDSATRLFRTYLDRLRKSIKSPIAWLAVPERTTSGLGQPAGAWHWHFVMAAPNQHRRSLERNAKILWNEHHGNAKIERYDPQLNGSFYISKLAGGLDFDFYFNNLDRLMYSGPTDLFAHYQTDLYVPQHVKHLTTGRTLVVR